MRTIRKAWLWAASFIGLLAINAEPGATQEKDPLPAGMVESVLERVKKGERWLRGKGLYENYRLIVNEASIPLGKLYNPTATGSQARFSQAKAELATQRLAVDFSARQVRDLKIRGIYILDSLLRDPLSPSTLITDVLRSEVIVEGNIVGSSYKVRPDGMNVAAKLVVTSVFRGKVAVGDTLHLLMKGGAHDLISYHGDGVKERFTNPRMVVGLSQKAYPLIMEMLSPPPKDLDANEYIIRSRYSIQGQNLVGVTGIVAGKHYGTPDDLRNVIQMLETKDL